MEEYFAALEKDARKAYSLALEARKKGLDPALFPEIPLAKDLAGRVEGLVGPKGVAARIRELSASLAKEEAALEIAREVVEGKFTSFSSTEAAAEQALRTSLAVLTEGIVAAPLEGIVKVKIKKNYDNTRYLGIYFAGPIRSAGGSAQAIAVLTGDYIRRSLGLDRYKPTEDEVERFAEEVDLYNAEASRLQYLPSSQEVRRAVRNIPIEITGESTDPVEVSGYRDLERIETNQVRGGAMLVLAEGVLQKAPKLLKYVEKFGLEGWSWLSEQGGARAGEEEEGKIKPNYKYIKDLIAGRPVLGHPSAKGGFRLRYGRSRTSGFAAASIHPATMVLLDDFIAIGTQIKTERPGKGAAVTPCDTIEGPIVKLQDGSVVRVENLEQAEGLRNEVREIIFLGDILIGYGEFLENNHPLMPSGYVEEWWLQELKSLAGEGEKYQEYLSGKTPSPEQALQLSTEIGVPLHPRYTYFFHNVTKEELRALAQWLSGGEVKGGHLIVKLSGEKRILDVLGVPHNVDGEVVLIQEYQPLKRVLGIEGGLVELKVYEKASNAMEVVNSFGITVRAKAPTYVGARMGRPEKARERRMQPAVNVLFPVGQNGGRTRDVKKAAQKEKITVEVARRVCGKCGGVFIETLCSACRLETETTRACLSCGRGSDNEHCRYCGGLAAYYDAREVNLGQLLRGAIDVVGDTGSDLKGVIGMTSERKIPEPLAKGILRSRNTVYVFKDGTVRFDATDVPLTHFIPAEIGVPVVKLRELGYDRAFDGAPLERDDQLVELKCQDVVLPEAGGNYLLRASNFMDELLVKLYGLEPFYNAESKEDLIGNLIIGLAPHTSAAILGRIIGFTKANACYAHPYFHAAKRRNCDGDEDALFLLLDGLINFSKAYLPSTRGGKMDAPLVLTTMLDPREVDDEVHNMDIGGRYPLEFYTATLRYAKPQEVKIEAVANRIGEPGQYAGFNFTHATRDINAGPKMSAYKTLGSMMEKVKHQLSLARKINAVDERDVARRVIEGHFLPDLAGNLRAFSKQNIRCVSCNAKYRRMPLSGNCRRCSGKLVLTVHKGSVEKYLQVTKGLIEQYRLDDYLSQRIRIIEMSISSVFENDGVKQVSLSDFFGGPAK